MAIPQYVIAANLISSCIFDIVTPTLLAGIGGGVVGKLDNRKYTYAISAVCIDWIHKFIYPYLIKPVFMNEKSNFQTKIMGIGVGYGTMCVISWLVIYKIVPRIFNEIQQKSFSQVSAIMKENPIETLTLHKLALLTATPSLLAVLREMKIISF